jgi:nucleotide-binding universal stress UspA family protein
VPAFHTVLAPTDLSPAGNRAVPFAYALLRERGGVVELCHVHERALPNPPYAYDDPRARLLPRERAALEEQLRALIPADAERFGITTHLSVIEGGQAATAIVQAAERLDVDAVSLGSHGRGGLARAVRGSVTDEVARHARQPVLVVRSDH